MSRRTPNYAKPIRLVLGDDWVDTLTERGFDYMAFIDVLTLGGEDKDQIALTHPVNWMTEDEIDNMERWRDF